MTILVPPTEVAAAPERWTMLDASWVYPPLDAAGIDVRRRYAEAHPPGALFLDLAKLSLPHRSAPDVPALRPPDGPVLRRLLATAGIGLASPLVVTDMDGGTTTAPFARLALLDAGFATVQLLAGGTPAWVASGLPLTDATPRLLDGERSVTSGGGRFVTPAATRQALADAVTTVIDARMVPSNTGILPERFADVAFEADAVLRPSAVLVDDATGQRFAATEAVRSAAEAAGLTTGRRLLARCHFGVGAAVVATALEIAGYGPVQADTDLLLGG